MTYVVNFVLQNLDTIVILTMTDSKNDVALKQKIGLLNGVTLIVGNIIGSGIFISPTGVHSYAGSVGLSLIVWAVSGIFSMLGAMCYAEYGTTITKSGASYAYILASFGKFLAFIRLWASVVIVEPSVQASQAVTMAKYIVKPLFISCDIPMAPERIIAAAAILFITAMNCYSVRYATRIQDTFAYAKVIALIAIIIAGGVSTFTVGVSESFDRPFENTNTDPSSIALAFFSGLYAFAGWDTLNFMTEEIKDPYTNLPKAIKWSMPICTIIYLLANVAYYLVLSPSEMLASGAVAVEFAGKKHYIFGWIISLFVAASSFGGLNASIMMSSRLFYVGAREKQLPDYFSFISIPHQTPAPAVLLSGLLTCFYLFIEDVFVLINYFSLCYWLFVALSVFGMVKLRIQQPNMHRPIKFNLVFHLVFSACCAFLVIAPFVSDTKNSLVGLLFVLSGVPVYFIFIYRNSPSFCKKISCSLTKTLQILFPCAPSSIELES